MRQPATNEPADSTNEPTESTIEPGDSTNEPNRPQTNPSTTKTLQMQAFHQSGRLRNRGRRSPKADFTERTRPGLPFATIWDILPITFTPRGLLRNGDGIRSSGFPMLRPSG